MQSWDDFRFFLAVARAGNLSAAARALDVSQPTVARRVAQLEAALGQQLLERDGTAWAITDAGREVLQFSERIEREALAIERIKLRAQERSRPVVRLTTTRGLAVYWLAPRIAMLEEETGARLSIQVGIPRSDLSHYQADIAVRMGGPGDEDLHGRQVAQVHCGLYAARAYLRARGEPQQLDELRDHAVIESEGAIAEIPQVRALRVHASETGAVGADCVTVQVALARQGLGVAAFPCFMADPHPELARVLPGEFDVGVPLWALVNRDLRRDPVVRRVFELVVREAVAHEAVFRGRPGTASTSV